MSIKAIVKSVISGDTLVLRGRPGPQGQPPKERILYLAEVTAPKMGTASREDEPWAFESREFLRAFAVGKEITFVSAHSLPTNDEVPRDIGTAEIAGADVTSELLKNGWVKLKEIKREPNEDDMKRRELENEAKTNGKGSWNSHGSQARIVHYSMATDPQAFLSEWKGKSIEAIVEQVRDGTTLRVRLLMPNGEHQMITVALAAVRSARASNKQGEAPELWSEEAKLFTESRLLQRLVRVQILSLLGPTATPFQTGPSGAPPSAATFVGTVLHPAGNVAEYLLGAGLARVVDWQIGLLPGGGVERLRAAEKSAKEKRLCLYADTPSASAAAARPQDGHSSDGAGRSFDATVIRVWSGDQITVIEKETGKEHRLQFSSTRGPKTSDPKQAFYAQEAKEYLRRRLIGKHVRVHVDFIRPRDGEFEERTCATVRYGGQNANIAEQLVEKGLAYVVRHKRDDENRSSEYDKLMIAEQGAIAEQRGIHSSKELPAAKPPLNVSETHSRATQFLNSFKRQGKIHAVVEYVMSGSRFRLLLPKENQILTLVLSGIRTPRAARNASEKHDPYGSDAAEFSTRRYMQRDVEFEIETVDKSGGFIGALYLNNRTENVAIALAREGLGSVHPYSADGLPWARQLYDAEAEAKAAKRNIWSNYEPEAEKATATAEAETQAGPMKIEYLDVVVSDVRTKNGFSFSIQVLNTEDIAALEKLMRDFVIYHRTAAAPANFVPKNGELVSAKFSDGSWYRAQVRRTSPTKKEAEVTFIDYGNQDTLGFKDIRPLDPKFRSLPGQARDARLSFVKLPGTESEYHAESIGRFRELCEGRKLIANVDYKEGNLLHLRLIDPTPESVQDPLASINADLLREGLAIIDRKQCGRYLAAYPSVMKRLQEQLGAAKRDRLGVFEFGDVGEDEDD